MCYGSVNAGLSRKSRAEPDSLPPECGGFSSSNATFVERNPAKFCDFDIGVRGLRRSDRLPSRFTAICNCFAFCSPAISVTKRRQYSGTVAAKPSNPLYQGLANAGSARPTKRYLERTLFSPVRASEFCHEHQHAKASQGVRPNRPNLHALSRQHLRWNGTPARARLQKPCLWLLRIDVPKDDLWNRALPELRGPPWLRTPPSGQDGIR